MGKHTNRSTVNMWLYIITKPPREGKHRIRLRNSTGNLYVVDEALYSYRLDNPVACYDNDIFYVCDGESASETTMKHIKSTLRALSGIDYSFISVSLAELKRRIHAINVRRHSTIK